MIQRKWIILAVIVALIGGIIALASYSEREAANKAKAFCANFKAGDSLDSASSLIRSTPASDKLLTNDGKLSIMFSSYDPQSVYACEIKGRDGKITDVQTRHLDNE